MPHGLLHGHALEIVVHGAYGKYVVVVHAAYMHSLALAWEELELHHLDLDIVILGGVSLGP